MKHKIDQDEGKPIYITSCEKVFFMHATENPSPLLFIFIENFRGYNLECIDVNQENAFFLLRLPFKILKKYISLIKKEPLHLLFFQKHLKEKALKFSVLKKNNNSSRKIKNIILRDTNPPYAL